MERWSEIVHQAVEFHERKILALTSPSENLFTGDIFFGSEITAENAREELDRVGVGQDLQAIRDSVWNEGTVTYVSANSDDGKDDKNDTSNASFLGGYRLESEPFPAIDIPRNHHGYITSAPRSLPRLDFVDKTVKLEVSLQRNDTGVQLTVYDDPQFSYSEDSSDYGSSLKKAIEKYHLQFGLQQLLQDAQLYYGFYQDVDTASLDAVDTYKEHLVSTCIERIRNHSLPSQMREYLSDIIGQIPQDIVQTGQMHRGQLFTWARAVRGPVSPIRRLLDRSILP